MTSKATNYVNGAELEHVPISKAKRSRRSKLEHVPIRQIPLNHIENMPENDLIYGKIDPQDPDTIALAADIRKNGVLEPLTVTSDYRIISGHRRKVAAEVAGFSEVPCIVKDYDSSDARAKRLLVSFNRQRVKTSAQVLREEVAMYDPDRCYEELRSFRRRGANVRAVDKIRLPFSKTRAAISPAKRPFLDAVLAVLKDYEDYLPLTDRQIHYALLNNPPLIHASKPQSRYRNDQRSYKALCDLITRARLEGSMSFDDIHDPTRPVECWNVHKSVAPFLRSQLDNFLRRYYRDLLQSQPNHIEAIGEKNTIESVIAPVLEEYCIPYTIGRGYSSLAPRYELAQRFEKSGKENLVLLFITDLDPEGNDIAESFARSMRDDFDIFRIAPVKVALTFKQVREMQLPPQMKAKEGSSRRKKFVERHGDNVFELEAVRPDRLQQILKDAIESIIDRKAFDEEAAKEKKDAAHLEGVRRRVKDALAGIDEIEEDQ